MPSVSGRDRCERLSLKIVGVLFALTLFLGTWGFHSYYARNAGVVVGGERVEALSWFECVLRALALPAFETLLYPAPSLPKPVALTAARILAPIVTIAVTMVLVAYFFGDSVRHARIRLLWVAADRLRRRRPAFTVICGLGWKGRELVRDLGGIDVAATGRAGPRRQPFHRVRGARLAVIEKNEDNAFISDILGRSVLFIGDATEARLMRQSCIAWAREVFVVTDSDETNCRITKQLVALRAGLGAQLPPIDCHTHVLSDGMRAYLEDTTRENRDTPAPPFPGSSPVAGSPPAAAGPEAASRSETRHGVHVSTFNTFELTARMLFNVRPLNWHPAWAADPSLGERLSALHVVVLGYTDVGRALLQHCLRTGHLPGSARVTYTVFAEEPEKARSDFLARCPCLGPARVRGPEDLALWDVVEYVFGRGPGTPPAPPLEFRALPRNDGTLLDMSFWRPLVGRGHLLSVFCCLDDGLRSAEYAARLAHPLQSLFEGAGERSEGHAKLMLYWNYPEAEIDYAEILGHMASPGTGNSSGGLPIDAVREGEPVTPPAPPGKLYVAHFGNLLETPASSAIRDACNESVAQMLALSFDMNFAPVSGWAERTRPQDLGPAEAWYFREARERWDHERLHWMRESNRQAADHFLVRLISLGVPFPEPGRGLLGVDITGDVSERVRNAQTELAEMEHRRWCAERLLGGWRPVRLPRGVTWDGATKRWYQARKLHADLCRFSDLAAISPPQQEKDTAQILSMENLIAASRALREWGARE